MECRLTDIYYAAQGARPELLPERLLGSVRFSHLDLKTAIPLNPDDYPDDLLEDFPLSPSSPPQSPNPSPFPAVASTTPTPKTGMENSQSAQSLHSLRSGSATGSNMSTQDMGHLEGLRQASGSSAQGQTLPVTDRSTLGSGHTSFGSGPVWSSHPVIGSGHMGSGHMGPGQAARAGSVASSNERPWPSQQTHASSPRHSAGLSTVPETQQSPSMASQQPFLPSQSMQAQRVNEAKAVGGSNLHDAHGPPHERVRWTDKAVMNGHF